MTVTWYVDDLKISHKDPDKVTKLILNLWSINGPMTMKQGKKHAYLGMDLYFTEKGTVKVLMTGYVDKDIDEFTKDVTTSVVSPAADHLFKINKN